MTPEELLPAMKTDLNIRADAYDDRLLDKIRVAIARIQAAGATLNDSPDDQDLVLMYAEWLWRERVTGNAMPRMVSLALNNRVFGEKAAAGGAV